MEATKTPEGMDKRQQFEQWAKEYQIEPTALLWHAYSNGWQAALSSGVGMDAERYRWLRARHWTEDHLCVVANPQKAVILGYNCPSLDRLDAAIDAALAKGD